MRFYVCCYIVQYTPAAFSYVHRCYSSASYISRQMKYTTIRNSIMFCRCKRKTENIDFLASLQSSENISIGVSYSEIITLIENLIIVSLYNVYRARTLYIHLYAKYSKRIMPRLQKYVWKLNKTIFIDR